MKTRELTKPADEESRWYESAAHPSKPGELTQAEPDDLAQAESEAEAAAKRRKLRWSVVMYVVVATIFVAIGNVFDSIVWASVALFYAISMQPRERVPKPLRYFATAAVWVLAVLQIVMVILKSRGH